jgi:phage terminase small subunit
MALNARQSAFVEEYLVDLNATQAAIRAGYSEATAKQQGSRLLTNVNVQAAIQEARAKRSKRTEITQDAVIEELAKIGFANMADYMKVGRDGDPVLNWSELTRDQAAALSEVSVEDFVDGRGEDAREVRRVKFKLGDKRRSLVDIGKHLGMFSTRTTNLNIDLSQLSTEQLERLAAGEDPIAVLATRSDGG